MLLSPLSLRKFQKYQKFLRQKPGRKNKYITIDAPITQEMTRALGALPGTGDKDQINIYYITLSHKFTRPKFDFQGILLKSIEGKQTSSNILAKETSVCVCVCNIASIGLKLSSYEHTYFRNVEIFSSTVSNNFQVSFLKNASLIIGQLSQLEAFHPCWIQPFPSKAKTR